jgi:hypothetical protein
MTLLLKCNFPRYSLSLLAVGFDILLCVSVLTKGCEYNSLGLSLTRAMVCAKWYAIDLGIIVLAVGYYF